MEVKLAGINVPKKLLDKIKRGKKLSKREKQALTPETLSAAYARTVSYTHLTLPTKA